MEKHLIKKGLVIAVIFLFIGSTFIIVDIENVQSCDCNDPPCWPEISGKMGNNNWYVRRPVEIAFNGTYNSICYRIDSVIWITYTAPIALYDEGIHILEWTCDCNMSDVYSMEIKVDASGPLYGNYTVHRVGLFKWRFSVDVFDDLSGVSGVLFYITNSTDTNPPFESTIWRGCLFLYGLHNLIDFLLNPEISWPIDAWDNAGNYLTKPS